MRLFFVAVIALGLSLGGCQDCPNGNKDNSVYCHAECAANETICGGACSNMLTDRDNCGSCGNQCGDGLVCSSAQCVPGCAAGLVNCGGMCVDTTADKANCGGCGVDDAAFVCRADESCVGGTCGCATTDVVCAGQCTNPVTSNQHCGASGDCTGAGAGTTCASNEGCLNSVCTSKLIYRGSLPAGTGRWQYNAKLGITGANELCAAHYPGSEICTYDKLLAASMKTPAETLNATDFNGVAVTSWWVDDPLATTEGRCTSNADAIPWSYQTADQGHVGKHVDLTPATGAVSALILDTLPSCNQNRNVPCCSTVVAP